MILTEWSEEERQRIHEYNLEKAKIEGRKIGLEEGRSEGFKEWKLQGLQEGKLQGLQEGKTEGLKEGRIQGLKDGMNDALRQTVLRMRKASFSIEQISLATGLTIESINQIINDKQS